MRGRLTAVVAQRPAIRLLIARDIRLKYERTALGYFWSILEPLLLAGVYTFVFSRIGRLNIDDYPLFVISGVLPWMWARGVITESTKALTSESKLVKTTAIPREVWVIRVVGTRLVDFVLAFPVIILIAVLSQHGPSEYFPALLLAIVLQTMLLTGLALLLSALNVILGDVQRTTRVITRLLFYTTPILYDVQLLYERFGPKWSHLYELNPFVGIFELYHAVWFGDRFAGWTPVYISMGAAVVALVVGWVTFARLEPLVLKEL